MPGIAPGTGNVLDNKQLNANGIVAEDSKTECELLFGKRDFYIGGGDNFYYSPVTDTLAWLLKAATSGLNNA